MISETVIYVEDDDNDVILMRRAWRKAGLLNPLEIVCDGEKAIQYLSHEQHSLPCLILLDLNLPRIPGLEVLKWIRERPATRTLQVVILSSSNQTLDLETAHALKADAYLIKPSDGQSLMQMVLNLKEYLNLGGKLQNDCLVSKKSAVIQQAT